MDPELLPRIVRVEAQFDGGKKYGTGVRLKPGWILTSQHILEHRQGGVLELASSVEVVMAKTADGQAPRGEAKVAWRGESQLLSDDLRALDAALLTEESLPQDLGQDIELVSTHLPSGSCETAGWTNDSVLGEDLVASEQYFGHHMAIVEHATVLPLQIEGLEPKCIDPDVDAPYGGMSGAPVFVTEGRYKDRLYGLVREAPRNRGDQLYAVSAPALLRNKGFRAHLEIEDPPPPHESLILATRRLLADDPDLAAELARSKQQWRAAWEAQDEQGGIDGLIAELGEKCELRELLRTLDLLAQSHSQDQRRVSNLRRWGGHLTALLAHQKLAQDGRQPRRQSGRVQMPVGSPNFSEAVLAAEHGEAPQYERREQGQKPVLQVAATQLEAGIRNERQAQDQMETLADSLLRADLATPRYLTENELDIIEGAEDQARGTARIKAIRLALEDSGASGDSRRRPYLLVTPKLRKQDQFGTLQAFLEYLAQLLPELEQVELNGEPEESLEFEHQLKPLWRILGIDRDQE